MELTIKQILQQAIAAHKEGNLQDAERLYQAILQSQPSHPDANHNLGVLAVSVNKTNEALPLFKTASEANPKVEQFWMSYIDALIKEKRFDNAKQVIEQAKKQGVVVEKLNVLERQLASINEAEKIGSLSPSQQQLNNLIEYYQTGQYGDAETLALSITQEFPKHQFGWKVLGATLKQTGRVMDSLTAMQKSMQLAPQDAEAHSNLGVTLQELGKLDEALASYKQAIALKPDYAEAHSNLGVTLQELGKFDEALASYKQAIALKPDFAEAHKNLGVTLQELGKFDEALASYKQAIALKPDYTEVYSNLGVTLKELGKFDEALASYKQAIALKPHYAETHYNLGVTLQELEKFDEALASYKQAIALKPDFAEVYSNLGVTLKELGKFDEALASYKQAIALKPDYANAYSNLGVTLQELGKLDEALASYKQAIALKPDFAEAHKNLAMVLIMRGLTESAIQHLQINFELERGAKPVKPRHKSFANISKAKIDHDIEQFEYLAASGYDIKKFSELAAVYKIVLSEIDCVSDTDVVPLSDKHRSLLVDTFNRSIHMLEAPALKGSTIGDGFDVNKITENYFEHEFGLTYVDEFLSPDALKSLREYLLGSTIWYDFFHEGGYIGAYLSEGLASPLVLQIAEDLRKKFPKIFKNHQLTQLWAYKYDSRASKKNNSFKGINVHADFAAINVNFWITPKTANLDKSSGGLVVYNSEAPLEWDFKIYNRNEEKILEEISKQGGKKDIIPYNENRAVIFNSNLFHETDTIDFKDGYENRRINVTILFGRREV
jgi:tetratricopeptide (TPR) repeat protein